MKKVILNIKNVCRILLLGIVQNILILGDIQIIRDNFFKDFIHVSYGDIVPYFFFNVDIVPSKKLRPKNQNVIRQFGKPFPGNNKISDGL